MWFVNTDFLLKVLFMIKYSSIFRLVLRCLLVARKENLNGFSTGLTGRSKNLDPTRQPDRPVDPTGAGRPDRFPSLVWRDIKITSQRYALAS